MVLVTCNWSLYQVESLYSSHRAAAAARFEIGLAHKWRPRSSRGIVSLLCNKPILLQLPNRKSTPRHCQRNDSNNGTKNINNNNKPALLEEQSEEASASPFAGDGDEIGNENLATKVVAAAAAVQVSQSVERDLHLIHLKEVVRLAQSDLERARLNSTTLEAKAQKFAERAIALGDEASNVSSSAEAAKTLLQDQLVHQVSAKEALEKAGLSLAAAKARIKGLEQELDNARLEAGAAFQANNKAVLKEKQTLEAAWLELQNSEEAFRNCQLEVTRLEDESLRLENEISRLDKLADAARAVAGAADLDVAKAMSLAEKAVALEVDAAQRLNDAEIALQKAENQTADASSQVEVVSAVKSVPLEDHRESAAGTEEVVVVEELAEVSVYASASTEEKNGMKDLPSVAELSAELEKEAKELLDSKRSDDDLEAIKLSGATTFTQKSSDGKAIGILKSFTKKSSRFFPASFFSSDEGEEFSPSSVFSAMLPSVKQNLWKGVAAALLLLGGAVYLGGKMEKLSQAVQTYEVSANIEDVATTTRPLMKKLYRVPSRVKALVYKLSHQEVNEEEGSLFDVLWLLLASVIFVPIFQKLPGGSPVLGYLAAGVLIGPHSLHIIRNVHGTKAIAEFGVVFLLFNIGLELSVERLSSMRKYVFGYGSSQVLATALACGLFAYYISGLSLPAAIVIGSGLALSSTAVVLQVLQERGEGTSRHGRAAFSVLLFQDLAVVVLLILIPLLSPNSSGGGAGLNAIAQALGVAAVKGVIAISGIIAGGRLLLRPIYQSMAENHNAEIFAANTLLVVLGTSVLTARAGLSMALGAFLAGLLLSETEYALQVESDIAPYRGLLLGLFFMTVGMSIDPQLFVARPTVILGSLALLILGKTLLTTGLGRTFGLSNVAALRTGLLLAPGGEFAFVAFGEAVNQGIMSHELSSLMFLVVGLSMAFTPWLAAAGQVASKFDQQDVRNLLPAENETDDLRGHMIVCGFGRVGQIISQMLSERLIPFVALDVRSERVSMGRALDLPVYFGDAGSREVLHKVGADRAAAAVITLDTPGANYRAVWALSKYFPKVKTYVRAHDVDHGINLEKAGATAVVPETLEPSLQLAAAVLSEAKLPASEIAATINEFRSRHLAELTELTRKSGTSLGYGYPQTKGTTTRQGSGEDEGTTDRRFEGVVAVP